MDVHHVYFFNFVSSFSCFFFFEDILKGYSKTRYTKEKKKEKEITKTQSRQKKREEKKPIRMNKYIKS